jgi:hypothetical protein
MNRGGSGIGLVGLIPIPGIATVALISAMLAQAPLIYGPMTRELAVLYNASPDSQTSKMVMETVELGALADVGVEFLKEIASDLSSEAAAGLALTAIPFLGGILAAGSGSFDLRKVGGFCARELDVFFTNNNAAPVSCTWAYLKDGVWHNYGGGDIQPGQTVGGEGDGDWTCSPDSGEIRYMCFPKSETATKSCSSQLPLDWN